MTTAQSFSTQYPGQALSQSLTTALHERHHLNTHPYYQDMLPDWELMRVSYAGQRAVKRAATKYLPATDGMIQKGLGCGDNSLGLAMYQNYLQRAKFPEFVKESVPKLVGLLNEGDTVFELPARLEPMRERATVKGEPLANLIRSIHEQILITGRIGLLGDVPNGRGPDATPVIACYEAESIKNWHDEPDADSQERSLRWVVLDESGFKQADLTSFQWTGEPRTRVIAIGDPDQPMGDLRPGVYGTALMVGDRFAEVPTTFTVPEIAGRTMDRVPFVFINRNDLVAKPDSPPLVALANHGMAVYLGEADHRWALHMQAQETLVITGMAQPEGVGEVPTGAGAVLWITDPTGDAKYVGVSSEGLQEMRQTLENDYAFAGELGSQVIEKGGNTREAAETLRIRQATRSTSLLGVARTAAEGLQQCLRHIAEWVGADPEEVRVIANTDFVEQEEFAGDDIKKITESMLMGAPLSRRSLHKRMQEHDMTEMAYEEELEAIEKEKEEFADLSLTEAPDDEEDDDDGVRQEERREKERREGRSEKIDDDDEEDDDDG